MNLNQVTVFSNDLETSIPFYEKLGLKLIVSSSEHYARFECPDGESTFSVHLTSEIINPGTIVYFETDQLDEKVQDLIATGILFDQLPVDQNWLWREAHLCDPDGNKIILYTAGENRKNPPWRLKSRKSGYYK